MDRRTGMMARQPLANEDQSVRLLKVGERVRHVLSELLMRQEVHDDTLTAHHISITEVRMSPALRLGLKFAPKLRFHGDESFDEAERIERLLNDPKVARDLGDLGED